MAKALAKAFPVLQSQIERNGYALLMVHIKDQSTVLCFAETVKCQKFTGAEVITNLFPVKKFIIQVILNSFRIWLA